MHADVVERGRFAETGYDGVGATLVVARRARGVVGEGQAQGLPLRFRHLW